MERCRSGRTGRSRKPLSSLRGTEGSNPSLSANPPFLNVSDRLAILANLELLPIFSLPPSPAVSYNLAYGGGKNGGRIQPPPYLEEGGGHGGDQQAVCS